METVKEFFDAIKGHLSERLANPFTGAFCMAWVIWNDLAPGFRIPYRAHELACLG
jgi:hypothetical protein